MVSKKIHYDRNKNNNIFFLNDLLFLLKKCLHTFRFNKHLLNANHTPGTVCCIFEYMISFKPHSNTRGGADTVFRLTERETRVSEVRRLVQAPGYCVGRTRVGSGPQSPFKIEKVKSVKGNSPLHMESEV